MKIEEGMYVRTTCGIGKIINAYIVYDDGGYLWRIHYITDNSKIHISNYTKQPSWRIFGEIQKDHRIKYEPVENNIELVKKFFEKEIDEIVCYVPTNMSIPTNCELFDDHKFIKASNNIIDLIEVGDYVNGELVLEKVLYGNNAGVKVFGDIYYSEDIKSIVTKEAMESVSYYVK